MTQGGTHLLPAPQSCAGMMPSRVIWMREWLFHTSFSTRARSSACPFTQRGTSPRAVAPLTPASTTSAPAPISPRRTFRASAPALAKPTDEAAASAPTSTMALPASSTSRTAGTSGAPAAAPTRSTA